MILSVRSVELSLIITQRSGKIVCDTTLRSVFSICCSSLYAAVMRTYLCCVMGRVVYTKFDGFIIPLSQQGTPSQSWNFTYSWVPLAGPLQSARRSCVSSLGTVLLRPPFGRCEPQLLKSPQAGHTKQPVFGPNKKCRRKKPRSQKGMLPASRKTIALFWYPLSFWPFPDT